MFEKRGIPRLRRDGALALAIMAAVLLGGCGRRGDLEPPPDPAAVKPPADPLHPQARQAIPPIAPPHQPFVLDPLL